VLAAVLTLPPGYVDDSLCADCHRELAATYRHVGMSQSFSRPRASNVIEDFDAPPYFHEKSKQYFEMRRRGDAITFRRYQLRDGKQVNVFEQMVDWILGSGHRSRTYLYATPGGELYQLPIAWYSQIRAWRMSPGYDRADHDGVTRRVRHECMFCHNAYPDVAKSSESYWRAQTFPRELPQGIGCQRCHGPGARHAAIALTGDMAKTKASIVNPAKLDARRMMDVCYECHLQPAVALFGVRRLGRDIYSFRPGQLLADYAPPLDIDTKDRFEINHHPYRLEQSRCFRESNAKLTCLTCHDPHRRKTLAEYRAACLSCHQKAHRASEDCIACHMPQRRTQDVVHAVMTDHLIQRKPSGDPLAPLEETEPQFSRTEFLYGVKDPLLLLLPLMRAHGWANANEVNQLQQLLAQAKPKEIEPYFDLAAGLLRQKRYADLEKVVQPIDHPLALEWLGIARTGQTGDRSHAIRLIEESLKRDPARAEGEFNLGLFLFGAGRVNDAIAHYQRALALRPNFAAAWLRLAEAQRKLGDDAAAAESDRRAAAIWTAAARPPL
ncbi:MAG TPA: tetratricopeptide repeat protein, partial [Thermoanaerobaculia bacterium]|nr:tetratricopeptide repeat protein [Thermoanaerobaculia bacterium]